ncbi:maleylpyruvate isomerase family mycothiol-dependent enzyme [Streptomyces coacervatus]|uniref:Maleylpyruvate isomerase family mycothiol-dependent enzyme n=1 Tax=Streptomyces coacervatus TaxID=647381 RepID=A0ABP7GX45_9ACTN|nr:TIGR03086 family metal-binding protein [Streptomyces coacervatus]MDF2272278.1 TIGR03086 family metal-binding protein [Streptomyces coacervatus]
MNCGELLERSLAYALGSVAGVGRGHLERGTPCAEWDLGELLRHLDDSLDALHEGLTGGRIGLTPWEPGTADLACAFRTRACAVLGAWAAGPGEQVLVGELPLDVRVMAAVGAVEITVHGWDVAQACGRPRPIPDSLAAELLPVARCVVAQEDRGVRFAAPVVVPACARPDARLLAFLGRRDSFPG